MDVECQPTTLTCHPEMWLPKKKHVLDLELSYFFGVCTHTGYDISVAVYYL